MGDENPIRTLGDYSKPSHEGYRNTIELLVGNNVHVNPIPRRTIDQSASGKLRDLNDEESWALLEDLSLYDNKSWNNPRDSAKPVKAIELPQDVPSTSDCRLIKLENQVQRLMEAYLAPTQPVQLNKKTVSEKLNNVSTLKNARNPMAPKSIAVISHDEREELRKKGIKSSSKFLSPKYLSPASIKELNKNPSAPKRVHFVNSIVILSTDSDTEEEDDSSTNACDLNLGGMVKGKEEVKEQGKEENEMETDIEVEEEIKEEESEFETNEEVEEIIKEEEDEGDGENFNSFPTMEELTHHEWLLKNPRPPWVKARIRAGSPNNIKISCMVGHFFKRHAYIDLESPINIMSRRQYNQIMTYGLRSRQKPSNPNKISNFVGRIRGLKIFIGSFAYECDFMILEDTTSIIDHHLGEMVFGRPFIEETGLVYNEKEGAVMFKQDDEKITFKMPHTMKIFKQTRLMGLSTDSIPPSAYKENFGHGRTHYYQSLLIGDEYKQDEGDRRGIRHLMRLEKEMMDNKGEVTWLYSLEDDVQERKLRCLRMEVMMREGRVERGKQRGLGAPRILYRNLAMVDGSPSSTLDGVKQDDANGRLDTWWGIKTKSHFDV
ncbi:MAK10-like protein [Tanacetum coccineum]